MGNFFPRDITLMPTYTRKATEGRQIKVVILSKTNLAKQVSFFWTFGVTYRTMSEGGRSLKAGALPQNPAHSGDKPGIL